MGHYLRLYKACIKRSLIGLMEYRNDFIIGILGFFIENLISILAIYFIVRNIPTLNGWNFYQMGFLYGFSMLPVSIDHLFTDELWRLAYFRVKNGSIDQYFLRPVPVLFQVIAETFQLDGIGEMIVGLFMTIFCGINCSIVWDFSLVILMLIAVIFGAIIITSFKIFTCAFSFIFKKSGPVMQIFYNFIGYTKYPINIYPVFFRSLLLFVIPYGLIISLPVETFLFRTWNPYVLGLKIIGMAAITLSVSIAVWTACIRRYESAGS